jgi:RNA polymerase sigma-70 factor (ECF subfamily)
MAAAQNGDAKAYQALLRACVPFATATARRQGVPSDRVEDVVQEILLTIHRARATYDPRRPFLPWLRAIAQRRAIDALRSRYRHGTLEVQDDDAARAVASPAPDAGEDLARADQNKILAAAVAALPPGQRQAVELLALQESTLEEASGKTGRSKVALKVNLHRAIHALRKTLAASDANAAPDSGHV